MTYKKYTAETSMRLHARRATLYNLGVVVSSFFVYVTCMSPDEKMGVGFYRTAEGTGAVHAKIVIP